MVAAIKAAAKDGDSLGGVVEVLAYGVPVGLGSHVHWDRRLDGLLAQALMSIQAVKAVEIGEGWDVAGRRGSEAHDAIHWTTERRPAATAATPLGPAASRAACPSGAWSSARVAMKPLATLNRPVLETVDVVTKESTRQLQGAHRRHRGAGHGRGGRDDDAPWCWPARRCASSAATRWPRSCATATASWPRWARRRRPSAAGVRHGGVSRPGPAGRDDGGRARPTVGRLVAERLGWRYARLRRRGGGGHRAHGARAVRRPRRGRLPGGRGRRCWPRRVAAARADGGLGGRRRGARPGQPGADRAVGDRWCGCGPTPPPWPAGWATAPAARCSGDDPAAEPWPASTPCAGRSTRRWPTSWSTSTSSTPEAVADAVLAAARRDRPSGVDRRRGRPRRRRLRRGRGRRGPTRAGPGGGRAACPGPGGRRW